MSGFSAEWLALREPFDRRARSADLMGRFIAAAPKDGTIVDLGAGAGANFAALCQAGAADRRWRLVDSDPALLAVARSRAPVGTTVETRLLDLAAALDAALDGVEAVAASALIDLVSSAWIDDLVAILARRRLPSLIALSVDGRHEFSPADPFDAEILAAFAAHQRRDKGFGPSLGPQAAEYFVRRLEDRGARVAVAASDWRIGADAPAMRRTTIAGLAEAALEQRPDRAAAIAAWRARRAAGALTIGHRDVLALW